ncbi:MAG: adenylate/guanylate cyclase domain-containing protein [bacterium]|nr:adenylate/guanylate cyclase domain-containing protein [bacterium]
MTGVALILGLCLWAGCGSRPGAHGDPGDGEAEERALPGLVGAVGGSERVRLRAPNLLIRTQPGVAVGTCRAGQDGWRPYVAASGAAGPTAGWERIFPRTEFELCYVLDEAVLEVLPPHPSLFIGRLWAAFEIYADDRLVYRGARPGEAMHFSWHLVVLPEAAPPRQILIRIQPDPDILFQLRDLYIGGESAHVFAVLRSQVDRFSLGVFFCLIGLFTIALSIVRYGERTSILSFNVLSFAIGAFTISLSDYSRLLYDRPDFWLQVSFFSLFVIPVALGVLTEQVLGSRFRKIVRVLWVTHLLHAALFLVAFAFTGLRYQAWLVISVFGMALISLAVFSAGALRQAWHGSPGTRIYTLGFFALVVTCTYDIAGGYLGRLHWERYTFHWGMLAFIFSLGYVLERRFALARRAFRRHAADLEVANRKLGDTNDAYARFVPAEFMRFLGKDEITAVALGDNKEMRLTIMVTDIHSFTTLSEQMTPGENFDFVNSYFKRLAPIIREHHGFIMKYMGDGVMALFAGGPETAIEAALEIQHALIEYNAERVELGRIPVQTGIGLHTGTVRLGVIGQAERMQGDVMSDAANLAARMEGLTKMYGARIVFSEETLVALDDPTVYSYRFLDCVLVKGKKQPVSVIELLQEYADAEAGLKIMTRTDFERGLSHYLARDFEAACESFHTVLALNPGDRAARLYLDRSEFYAEHGTPPDWEGVEVIDQK